MNITTIKLSTTASVTYGFHASPFGECLIASSNTTLCFLAFTNNNRAMCLADLRKIFRAHTVAENNAATLPLATTIFGENISSQNITISLNGTDFQQAVWRALCSIPFAATVSYQQVAAMIDKPHAHRAVARAIGANAISVIIPCHRVLRKDGSLGGYRWGIGIKKRLLDYEKSYCAGSSGNFS